MFEVGPTDRVLIVGRTGSGKSTLARALFYTSRNLVVIDPKHEEELPRSLVAGSPAEFRQAFPQRSTRVVYRPDPTDSKRADVGEVVARVLAKGRTRLLYHETVDYATASWIEPQTRRAFKVGRSLEVSTIALSQRPMGLHNDVIAECEHVFIFDLAVEGDRDKLAAIVGERARARIGRPFAFLYAGPGTNGEVVPCEPLSVRPADLATAPPNKEARSWSAQPSGISSS